jgi:hypothetical protein
LSGEEIIFGGAQFTQLKIWRIHECAMASFKLIVGAIWGRKRREERIVEIIKEIRRIIRDYVCG